jgi:hypothetical protein
MRPSRHAFIAFTVLIVLVGCTTTTPPDTTWHATMVSQQQTMIDLLRVTPVPANATTTAEPQYQATAVALAAAAVTIQAQVNTQLGTQTAQNASLIRIAQTSNALTDTQNTLLRTVRDQSTQALKLQSTAISLAAAANAIANKQLQQATSTDATAIAIQRSQTGVLVAQSATQKDIAYQTALTSYYACRTMLNTKPAITLTCSKPKK